MEGSVNGQHSLHVLNHVDLGNSIEYVIAQTHPHHLEGATVLATVEKQFHAKIRNALVLILFVFIF